MTHLGMKKAAALLLILLLCCMLGCFGNSSEESSGDGSTSEGPSSAPELSSQCGTVVDELIVNPVPAGVAEPVNVATTGLADTVVITPSSIQLFSLNGPILVKLHGVDDDGVHPSLVSSANDLIESSTADGAYYVSAGESCGITADGGGSGTLGAVFTSSGESLAELLLEQGGVVPTQDICSGSQLLSCYQSIEPEERVSYSTISWFLWKPQSERDGNVTVLVDPYDITVRVTGSVTETFVDFGPSNGRGTTARGNRPGCSYGQATVEFFDSDGARVLINDGRRNVTLSGCDRLEFRA